MRTKQQLLLESLEAESSSEHFSFLGWFEKNKSGIKCDGCGKAVDSNFMIMTASNEKNPLGRTALVHHLAFTNQVCKIKTCSGCGSHIMTQTKSCTGCGIQLKENAKFCNECLCEQIKTEVTCTKCGIKSMPSGMVTLA